MTAPDVYFKDPSPNEDDDAGDAWGDMNDVDEAADAWGEPSDSTTDPWSTITTTTTTAAATSKPAKKTSLTATTTTTSYDDDGAEPDFAGWLAAQAQKKKPGAANKPLPRGLAKKPLASRSASAPAAKPAVAKKKIDMKPKDTSGDDDGWGDGW